jgi:hypothetical protein
MVPRFARLTYGTSHSRLSHQLAGCERPAVRGPRSSTGREQSTTVCARIAPFDMETRGSIDCPSARRTGQHTIEVHFRRSSPRQSSRPDAGSLSPSGVQRRPSVPQGLSVSQFSVPFARGTSICVPSPSGARFTMVRRRHASLRSESVGFRWLRLCSCRWGGF